MASSIITSLLTTALKAGAKGAYKWITARSVIEKAIAATDDDFPELEILDSLVRWCDSAGFQQIFERLQVGDKSLTDAEIIHSFIEDGEFYVVENIEQEAARILAKFAERYREQALLSEQGTLFLANQQRAFHAQTQSALEQSVARLSRQISELAYQSLPPSEEQRGLAGNSETGANGSDVSVDNDPALRRGVVSFLKKLRDFGLDQCVVFRPEELAREDLRDFCLPARVLTEDEYSLLERERQSPRDPAIEEPDYIFPTNDIFWRRTDGRLFATPKLLNRVLESSRRHVILRGEPGEGKSTALWLYVAEQCQLQCDALERSEYGANDPRCVLPLALPLSSVPSIASKTVDDSISAFARSYVLALTYVGGAPEELKKWVDRRISERRFTLSLDALDELAEDREEWLRAELRHFADVRVLLTTRLSRSDYNFLERPERLRLICLGASQIREFISRYFAKAPNGLRLTSQLRERLRLSPGPRHLAQLPLLLAILCHRKLSTPDESLPQTRTDLLGLGLRQLFERGNHRRGYTKARVQRNEAKEEVLRFVAWRFQGARSLVITERELLRLLEEHLDEFKTSDRPSSAEDLRDEFLRDGVFVPKGTGRYSFILRSFHEYCLAGWIARRSEAVRAGRATFIRLIRSRTENWGTMDDWGDIKPLNQPGWRHVWPLVAGQMERPLWLLDAVEEERAEKEDLLYSRLSLAAVVAAELITEANGLQYAPVARVQGMRRKLAPLSKDLICIILNSAARPKDRADYAASLAQIADEESYRALAERLADTQADLSERVCSADALGILGSDQARNALIGVMNDDAAPAQLRGQCAAALRFIGDETSRDTLIGVIQSDELQPGHPLQLGSLIALADIADPLATEALIRVAANPNEHREIRQLCVREWGRAGGSRVRDALIELLRSNEQTDRYYNIKEHCAVALGEIGDETAMEVTADTLLNQFEHEHVRQECAASLAIVGGERAREVLWQCAMNSPPHYLLLECLKSLGRIGDADAIKMLAEMFEQPKTPDFFRADIAMLFGESHNAAFHQMLVSQILNNSNLKVCVAAAKALGRAGTGEAQQSLSSLLSNESLSSEVRIECAIPLVEAGNKAARKLIQQTLFDDTQEFPLRSKCAQSLGNTGDEEAVNSLAECLASAATTDHLRSSCLDALRRLYRRTGWRPLQKGGAESP